MKISFGSFISIFAVALVLISNLHAMEQKRKREYVEDERPAKQQRIDADSELIAAVSKGDAKAVSQAFRLGANPKLQHNGTSLFYAALSKPELARLFLENGFNPDAGLEEYLSQENGSFTSDGFFGNVAPLFVALQSNNPDAAKELFAYGAQFSFLTHSGIQSLHQILSRIRLDKTIKALLLEMYQFDAYGDVAIQPTWVKRLVLAKGLLARYPGDLISQITFGKCVDKLNPKLKKRAMRALCEPLVRAIYKIDDHCNRLHAIHDDWLWNLGLTRNDLIDWYNTTDLVDKHRIYKVFAGKLFKLEMQRVFLSQLITKSKTDVIFECVQ